MSPFKIMPSLKILSSKSFKKKSPPKYPNIVKGQARYKRRLIHSNAIYGSNVETPLPYPKDYTMYM